MDYVEWAFPFPEGDETILEQIMVQMVVGDIAVEALDSGAAYVVRIEQWTSLFYLKAAEVVDDLEDDNGTSILHEKEAVVLAKDREECERLLREHCPSDVRWFKLVHVIAKTNGDMAAFRAAYERFALRTNEYRGANP